MKSRSQDRYQESIVNVIDKLIANQRMSHLRQKVKTRQRVQTLDILETKSFCVHPKVRAKIQILVICFKIKEQFKHSNWHGIVSNVLLNIDSLSNIRKKQVFVLVVKTPASPTRGPGFNSCLLFHFSFLPM